MSASITITDNGNGTAAAAISGSAGASNVVYAAQWDGVATIGPGYAWAQVGTLTGDGSLTLSPTGGFGFYVWQLVSNGVLANYVYQPLIDPSQQAHHLQIMQATQVIVKSLTLAGIGNKVTIGWLPRQVDGTWLTALSPPACFIAPNGIQDMLEEVLQEDDPGYPVVIALVDKLQGDNVLNMNQDLLWRQKINRALRRQRLAGTVAWTCKEVPQLVVDPSAFALGYFLSVCQFRFVCRESRGLT